MLGIVSNNKKVLYSILSLYFYSSITVAGSMGNDSIETAPWQGLYFGINAGGGIASDNVNQSVTYSTASFPSSELLNTQSRYSLAGGMFGGQIGYNQERYSWVMGVEGDIEWVSLGNPSNNHCSPSVSSAVFYIAGGNGFGYCLMNKPQINNLGTIRGRIGYIFNNVLWYATGGGAWSSVESSFSSPAEKGAPGSVISSQSLFLANSVSFSTISPAWTVGGGVESKLWGHFSAKAEYLYINYGHFNNSFPLTVNPAYPSNFTAGSLALVNTSSSMTSNIIRLGVNYKI